MKIKNVLFGLLATDGCISGRFVIFHNKSEALHEIFKQCIRKMFGEKTHFTERVENNGTGRTQVNSKNNASVLLKMFGLNTMKRKKEAGRYPDVKIPEFVKTSSISDIQDFFRIVFSCDGSISLSVRWHKGNKKFEIRRRVELSCEHPQLRKDYLELLQKLGFSPRTNGINITMEKKRDIKKFNEEIGFILGVKIGYDSKLWHGFEKNEVLTKSVKTFNIDTKLFKDKESLLGHLKIL